MLVGLLGNQGQVSALAPVAGTHDRSQETRL
jgi:hypothetical protein